MSDDANTSHPYRVQLRRTKGWRKPDNTVVVARPSRWGNPFAVGDLIQWPSGGWRPRTAQQAVDSFRTYTTRWMDVTELRGKNLACWCPLEDAQGNRVPCHADVLLELANREVQ